MQVIILDGFVIVTSPQALAKLDAKRSINMVRKLKVNVLGAVENFSGEMFGTGAGEELAEEMGMAFFGRIDLRPEYKDTTKPVVLSSPVVAAEYQSIVLALEPVLAAAIAES